MEKRTVGENAGKVWHAMNQIEEITIPELARKLDLSEESTAMAVGWLAREGKICIDRKDGQTVIYNENHFTFCFG